MGAGSCVPGAWLLVPQGGCGAAPTGWRATNKTCANTTLLQELWGGPHPITDPFLKAHSCRTPAIPHIPCALQDTNPAPDTEPPSQSSTLGQGWLNTTQASGFLTHKALLPGLTPSKSDFTEH